MGNIDEWSLRGARGQLLYGNTHRVEGEPRGVAVLLHGFKGYKDYGFIPRLAEELAGAGLVAHRYNFSHSGMTNQVERFGRPDLFERDTWGKQVADVGAVLEGIESRKIEGAGLPVVLFGHSRGGLTALLSAAEHGGVAGVVGVVAAAAPADAVRLDHDQREELRRRGRLPLPSSRTGQTLHVGLDWLEEVEADPEQYDPLRAIAGLDIPVLLLHGTEDDTVPPHDARRLHEASDGRAELRLIEGANHTFNAANPMPRDAEVEGATRQLFDAVRGFAVEVCR